MFSAFVFALKVILSGLLIVPFSVTKNDFISRDDASIYSLIAVISSALTAIAKHMESGIIAASLFVIIGIISYSQFQKWETWIKSLHTIAPIWLSATIGTCVGAGMFLQAVILTAIAFYIIHYLPLLLKQEKETDKELHVQE